MVKYSPQRMKLLGSSMHHGVTLTVWADPNAEKPSGPPRKWRRPYRGISVTNTATNRIPVTNEYHGVKVVEEFHGLEDATNRLCATGRWSESTNKSHIDACQRAVHSRAAEPAHERDLGGLSRSLEARGVCSSEIPGISGATDLISLHSHAIGFRTPHSRPAKSQMLARRSIALPSPKGSLSRCRCRERLIGDASHLHPAKRGSAVESIPRCKRHAVEVRLEADGTGLSTRGTPRRASDPT